MKETYEMFVQCPVCGAPLDNGDVFCIRCGASVAGVFAAGGGLTCTNCGAALEPGTSFCI